MAGSADPELAEWIWKVTRAIALCLQSLTICSITELSGLLEGSRHCPWQDLQKQTNKKCLKVFQWLGVDSQVWFAMYRGAFGNRVYREAQHTCNSGFLEQREVWSPGGCLHRLHVNFTGVSLRRCLQQGLMGKMVLGMNSTFFSFEVAFQILLKQELVSSTRSSSNPICLFVWHNPKGLSIYLTLHTKKESNLPYSCAGHGMIFNICLTDITSSIFKSGKNLMLCPWNPSSFTSSLSRVYQDLGRWIGQKFLISCL